MYKLIAIMGKAGTGKDTLLRRVVEWTSWKDIIHEIISYTTRPIREGEKNGVNYIYLTKEEFLNKINNKEMFEWTEFNGWLYGTGIDSFDENKINIGVFNPAGIKYFLNDTEKKFDITVYCINTTDKTRLLRQLNREENPDVPEIIRRYKTDESDFNHIDFETIPLRNELESDLAFNAATIVTQILL